MSLSSISSSTGTAAIAALAKSEQAEATRGGRDVRKDNDGDEAVAAARAPAKATVNSNGQVIGSVLSTQA